MPVRLAKLQTHYGKFMENTNNFVLVAEQITAAEECDLPCRQAGASKAE
jgi:hypothetical protein